MRTKKNAITISLISAVFSLIGALLFYFLGKGCRITDFISNAFLGVFASSVATILVFIYEYREERSKAITDFCRNIDQISNLMDQLIFLPTDVNGNIDERCIQKRGNRTVVEEQCDKYIAINNLGRSIEELFYAIDFFCDFPIKEWWEMHRLKPIDKKANAKLTKSQKRYEKEKAKAMYWDEHYEGKKKQRIRLKIIAPLNQLLGSISRYALNEFRWYKDGRTEQERKVIEALLELQELVYETDPVEKKVRPWLTATYSLSNILVGSKLFWMENEEKRHGI